ncbi:MAG: 4Fe-4S binding protein [Coriobacteriia bacterium]|nr:4Fe-4S binding protein [Coriobacteriia bacterium]
MQEASGCCGCTACKAVCPQDAIAMVTDIEGFQYPQIDPERCVGCMLCVRVCPMRSRGLGSSLGASDGG